MQETPEHPKMSADEPKVMSLAETPQPSIDINSQQGSAAEHGASIAQLRFDEFTLFPKLPTELRLIIWKFALPNGAADDGKRIFCLNTQFVNDDTRLNAIFYLTTSRHAPCDPSPRNKAEMNVEYENWRRDMRDVGLLRACKESRDVFLRAFPHTLSTTNGGVIRFDDQTTIHVENWYARSLKYVMKEAFQKNLQLPSINTVRRLALVIVDYEPGKGILGILRCLGGLTYISLHRSEFSFLPKLVQDNDAEKADWDGCAAQHT